MNVPHAEIERVVRAALAEDAPWGDATSEAMIAEDMSIEATLMAREAGVFCGVEMVTATMMAASEGRGDVHVRWHACDGDAFGGGDALARIEGSARAILLGERVALNLAQRMSGIATMTAAFVREVQGTGARIVDTRKTTPGLRALERYAVRCGGGHNHRWSLSDAVLVKDNHLAIAAKGGDSSEALRGVRNQIPHTMHFEVEVDRMEQIEAALEAGAQTILLDNFSLADLKAGVALIAGRAMVEASGGVTLATVRAIAETGVDIISVGALTHSVRALDLALDIL